MPLERLRNAASARKKPPKMISPASRGSRRAGRVSAIATIPISANTSIQAPWSPKPVRNRRSSPGEVPKETEVSWIVAATCGATSGAGVGSVTLAGRGGFADRSRCGMTSRFSCGPGPNSCPAKRPKPL